MTAVLKHELRAYFHSLTAYVFGAFLLAFVGIGAMMYNLQAAVSNFEYVLSFGCLVFVVIVPILTMRVIAEERKQKTDQLLYSLPITTTQVVIGKYLALLTVYLIPLCIICIYPLIFSQFGDVYLLTSYGSVFAFFVLGAALIAVGVFISSLTENQGFAAGIGIAAILLNYYSVSLSEYVSSTATGSVIALGVIVLALGAVIRYLTKNDNLAYAFSFILLLAIAAVCFIDSSKFEGLLPRIMEKLSLFERFYTFVNGVFDMTAIVYFLSVIVFFLCNRLRNGGITDEKDEPAKEKSAKPQRLSRRFVLADNLCRSAGTFGCGKCLCFCPALRNDKIRHQLYEIVLRYKQHKGSCERTGAGRDDLLDRSIRKRGRHH